MRDERPSSRTSFFPSFWGRGSGSLQPSEWGEPRGSGSAEHGRCRDGLHRPDRKTGDGSLSFVNLRFQILFDHPFGGACQAAKLPDRNTFIVNLFNKTFFFLLVKALKLGDRLAM